MVEKISVLIALEGGKEVERQLAGIGETGQKAFDDLAKSAEKVGGFKNLKTNEVTASLKAAGVAGKDLAQVLNAVGAAVKWERLVVGVRAAEAAFVGLARAAGVVGVAIAAGMAAATRPTIKFAEEINKASADAIKLGLSIEKFDQMRLSLEKAGAPANVISSGIATLKQNLEQLDIKRIKELADNLLQLASKGVRFAPGAAPGLQELIDKAKEIGPVGDAAREALERLQTAAAMQRLGPEGQARLQKLIETARGLGPEAARARAELEKFGISLNVEKLTPFEQALKKLGIDFGPIEEKLPEIIEKLAQMAPGTERNKTALAALGQDLGTFVTQFLNAGGSVDDLKTKLGLLTTEQENTANRLDQAVNRMMASWNRFGSVAFAPALTAQINLVTQGIDALGSALNSVGWDMFANAGVGAFKLLQAQINALSFVPVFSGIQTLMRLLDALITKMSQVRGGGAASVPGIENQPGQGVGGFAGGGLLGGRGTGTSDSNLAWVSRGEHIMPARAVAQPGVLAFLEALRRSGGNLRGILDGMGRFAMGGLVPRSAMAFAAGGMVGGGANLGTLTLGLPSGGSVSVRASSDVVDQLRKEAALAQVRSGGRKPSRYS